MDLSRVRQEGIHDHTNYSIRKHLPWSILPSAAALMLTNGEDCPEEIMMQNAAGSSVLWSGPLFLYLTRSFYPKGQAQQPMQTHEGRRGRQQSQTILMIL
jgi:hypothetical protein